MRAISGLKEVEKQRRSFLIVESSVGSKRYPQIFGGIFSVAFQTRDQHEAPLLSIFPCTRIVPSVVSHSAMTTSTPSLLKAAYSPLPINKVFYDKVAQTAGRELAESFILPIRSGKAWKVGKGEVFRISTPEGPQVSHLHFLGND